MDVPSVVVPYDPRWPAACGVAGAGVAGAGVAGAGLIAEFPALARVRPWGPARESPR